MCNRLKRRTVNKLKVNKNLNNMNLFSFFIHSQLVGLVMKHSSDILGDKITIIIDIAFFAIYFSKIIRKSFPFKKVQLNAYSVAIT